MAKNLGLTQMEEELKERSFGVLNKQTT